MLAAASQRAVRTVSVTLFGDPTININGAGLPLSRRQSEVCTDSSGTGKAQGIVNTGSERQRCDGSYTWHRHKAAAQRISSDDADQCLVQGIVATDNRLPYLQHCVDEGLQRTVCLGCQLKHAGFKTTSRHMLHP
jgi:hypothetical protein